MAVQPIPANARSTMFVEKFAADLDLYQPVQLKEVPELYREYCYLRETEPVILLFNVLKCQTQNF